MELRRSKESADVEILFDQPGERAVVGAAYLTKLAQNASAGSIDTGSNRAGLENDLRFAAMSKNPQAALVEEKVTKDQVQDLATTVRTFSDSTAEGMNDTARCSGLPVHANQGILDRLELGLHARTLAVTLAAAVDLYDSLASFNSTTPQSAEG